MIRKNKKGFTLVELLAVIVILAIILVIAVPKIMNVIKDTTKASLESSAKMVAAQVENQYTVAQTLGQEFSNTGSCMKDWAGLNDTDYESCTYEIGANGNATVTLIGKGKFKDLSVCNGTRSGATAKDGSCGITCKDNEVLSEGVCVKATNESCFDFDSSTGTILEYYLNENNDETKPACPMDVIIPSKINGVAVTMIGEASFHGRSCDYYGSGIGVTSVVIPNGIKEIGNCAFQNNEITSVKFSSNLKKIGYAAFSGNSITGILDLSNTNLEIIECYADSSDARYGAFWGNQITSVKLPSSITEIEKYAFEDNPNLTTIVNPSGNSFDWFSITLQGTSDTCTFATGTCGNVTISAS